MTPHTHKRYLDYRARHEYFGKNKAMLGAQDFAAADAELEVLEARGEGRDDEEEARYAELLTLLLKD